MLLGEAGVQAPVNKVFPLEDVSRKSYEALNERRDVFNQFYPMKDDLDLVSRIDSFGNETNPTLQAMNKANISVDDLDNYSVRELSDHNIIDDNTYNKLLNEYVLPNTKADTERIMQSPPGLGQVLRGDFEVPSAFDIDTIEKLMQRLTQALEDMYRLREPGSARVAPATKLNDEEAAVALMVGATNNDSGMLQLAYKHLVDIEDTLTADFVYKLLPNKLKRYKPEKRVIDFETGETVTDWIPIDVPKSEVKFNKFKEVLDDAHNDYVARTGTTPPKGQLDLLPDEEDTIRRLLQEADEKLDEMTPDNVIQKWREQQGKLAEANRIIKDKIPFTTGDILGSITRTNLLFNIPTQARNVLSNAVNAMMTTRWSTLAKGFNSGAGVLRDDIGKLKPSSREKVIPIGRTTLEVDTTYNPFLTTKVPDETDAAAKLFDRLFVNNTNPLGQAGRSATNMTGNAIGLGDKMFKLPYIEQELARLQGKGIQDTVALDIALKRAEFKLFQNDTQFGGFLEGVRDGLNRYTGKLVDSDNLRLVNPYTGKGFGLGDMVAKFTKTPAAIAMQALSKNPLQGLRGAVNLYKSQGLTDDLAQELARHDAIRQITDGLTGTGLVVMGAWGIKSGYLTGDFSKNYVDRQKQIESGWKPWSIKLGDDYYTYTDVLGPAAIPVVFGSKLEEGLSSDDPFMGSVKALWEGVEKTAIGQLKAQLSGDRLYGAEQDTEWIYRLQDLVANSLNQITPASSMVRRGMDFALPNQKEYGFRRFSPLLTPLDQDKVGITGEPIPNQQYMNPFTFIDPFKVQSDTLPSGIDSQGALDAYDPPRDTMTRSKGGVTMGYELTPEQHNALKQRATVYTNQFAKDTDYANQPPLVQEQLDRKITTEASKRAWQQIISEFGLTPERLNE
jgi:hypothetical protein